MKIINIYSKSNKKMNGNKRHNNTYSARGWARDAASQLNLIPLIFCLPNYKIFTWHLRLRDYSNIYNWFTPLIRVIDGAKKNCTKRERRNKNKMCQHKMIFKYELQLLNTWKKVVNCEKERKRNSFSRSYYKSTSSTNLQLKLLFFIFCISSITSAILKWIMSHSFCFLFQFLI